MTMFGNIGMPELILIFLVVLLLFGAKKLPELAQGLGKGIREFKKAMREEEPPTQIRSSEVEEKKELKA